ncbi:MAG: hypothetical protein ACR2MQ_11980 [Gemmatimonadaceae bacterium]
MNVASTRQPRGLDLEAAAARRARPGPPRRSKIKNVAAFVVTPDEIDFTAKLLSADPATPVPVTFQKGFPISTLQPDPALPPLPTSERAASAAVIAAYVTRPTGGARRTAARQVAARILCKYYLIRRARADVPRIAVWRDLCGRYTSH